MRVLAGFLVIAAVIAFLPQGSSDLHKRYGEADRERFIARPGIALTVEYGSDHLICEALIDSPEILLSPHQVRAAMSPKGVSEVLEEVAPTAMRGKVLKSVQVETGCNSNFFWDYENVTINQSISCSDQIHWDSGPRTEIYFKRDACPKLPR
jgi:hypothetical protein